MSRPKKDQNDPELFDESIQGGEVSPLASDSSAPASPPPPVSFATPLERLPEGWRIVTLGSICEKIGSGATPKGGASVYLANRSQYAFIRSQNVLDGYFSSIGLVYISDEDASILKNVWLKKSDVLLNITGDGETFGRSCIVPESILPACVNQHVSIIRAKSTQGLSKYINAFLLLPTSKTYIESFNAGGSRRAITKGNIESFLIPLPPLKQQQKISAILSSLDDKIALNRATNKTLEDIARALFKSWFVDFDPVRAKARGEKPLGMDEATAALFPDSFEESELGMLPKGWQRKQLGEILELTYGKALVSTDRIYGPIPVYGSGGIAGNHNASLVHGPGIIIGRKGTIGSIYWESRDFFPIDTTFYVVAKSGIPLLFIFYLLQTFNLPNMNADAAVPGLNRSAVYRLDFPNPPIEIIVSFSTTVLAIQKAIEQKKQESNELVSLRDTLLPKLLSGELSVADAADMADSP